MQSGTDIYEDVYPAEVIQFIQQNHLIVCLASGLSIAGIINIILGAVVLFVVVVLFLWVSSKHKESGLGDTCSGNCSSCSAHCSTGSKDKK